MRTVSTYGLLIFLAIAGICPPAFSQTPKALSAAPKIDVLDTKIEADLNWKLDISNLQEVNLHPEPVMGRKTGIIF